jgi:hypothetical protein
MKPMTENNTFWPFPKGTILFEHVTPYEIKSKEEAEKHPLAWKLIAQEGNVLIAKKVSNPEFKKKCIRDGWDTFRN